MAVNLTTLKRVKDFMGLDQSQSDKDALLEWIIDSVSQQIAEYCGRTLAETTHKVWLDGSGSRYQRLPEYPLKRVYGVSLNTTDVGTIQYTGSGSIASAYLSSSNLNLMHVSSSGVDTESNITLAGKTVGELSTAINNVTGWSFSTASNASGLAATQIRPFSSGDVVSPSDYDMETADDYDAARISSETDSTIELERGACFPCGMSNVFVWYKAGYTLPTEADYTSGDVPEGLEMVCVKIVKDVFDASKVDQGLKSEKIGDYSYTLGGGGDGKAPATEAIARYDKELWPYMRKEI